MMYIQWNLSFGTPLFKRHLHSEGTQHLVPEKCHVIFVFVSSIEGTPLFMGKGLFFDSGSQTWIQPLFLVHLSTQKVTSHKKP